MFRQFGIGFLDGLYSYGDFCWDKAEIFSCERREHRLDTSGKSFGHPLPSHCRWQLTTVQFVPSAANRMRRVWPRSEKGGSERLPSPNESQDDSVAIRELVDYSVDEFLLNRFGPRFPALLSVGLGRPVGAQRDMYVRCTDCPIGQVIFGKIYSAGVHQVFELESPSPYSLGGSVPGPREKLRESCH